MLDHSHTSVLIVDDSPTIRTLVAAVLEDDGYQVQTAEDGRAALEAVAQHPPALIFLDMEMPEMDGWSFADAYHSLPLPHAPIVVMTARHANTCAHQVEAAAALQKPFGILQLLDLVDRLVA